jgi:hypothetical protein
LTAIRRGKIIGFGAVQTRTTLFAHLPSGGAGAVRAW